MSLPLKRFWAGVLVAWSGWSAGAGLALAQAPGPTPPAPASPRPAGPSTPSAASTPTAPTPPAGAPATNDVTPGTGGATTTSAAVNAPTQAEAGVAPPPQTNFLARFLGVQDSPVKVYGWLQNSFTGNADGRPKDDSNFSVFPNRLADQWQGNQYYLAFEKTLSTTDTDRVNFGGRFDFLFGNDWQFTKDYGLFDRAFVDGHFAGIDLPQIYAEVHLPILTPGGLDIRGGRFYSPAGFENVQAIKRPMLSVAYAFNYTPFTLFGTLATLHLNPRVNVYSGAVNGWDRWIDQNYKYSYVGGINANSKDGKTAFTSFVIAGPDQLPRFAPANSPFLPTGVVTTPALQGKVNPYYAGNWRVYMSNVLTHNWSDKLTQANEVFFVHETNVDGLGPNGGLARESAWYGATNFFIYSFSDKVQGVWRSEIFRDNNGGATGQADNYYEITLGLPYKPKPWLWIRPEARYDWAQYHRPFDDGTRNSQLTLAVDVVIQF